MAKPKNVSEFATYYINPSVAKMTGMQKFSKEVPFKEDVLITKKATGESYDSEVDGENIYLEEDSRDRLKFTKVYAGTETGIARLSGSAVGVLMYIIRNMKQDHDEVTVSAEMCRQELAYKQRTSVYDGLFALLEAEFIYRKAGPGSKYFVNVNKIFKGRRTKLLGP